MTALAAALCATLLATPSLAPKVPHMTAPVVNVHARRVLTASSLPFIRDLLPHETVSAVGSGIIISSDGLILTNHHIIRGSTDVRVSIGDQHDLPARVVAQDPSLDVALLRVSAGHPLPKAKLGSSGRMRVGDYVVAVGNPFGLSHTVTSGIVSAQGRVLHVGPDVPLIQTDAPINPGNSGGPLYDLHGRVVGLNTAIVAGASGIGFALPIDVIKRALPQLESQGHITRGFAGVRVGVVPATLARAIGLPTEVEGKIAGALVERVVPGSPSAKAGLLPGDVILRWDGRRIDSAENLPWLVELTPPGTEVRITILRDHTSLERRLKMATLPHKAGSEGPGEGRPGLAPATPTP